VCRGDGFLKIDKLHFGSWYSNCYVVTSGQGFGKRHAAVVDPAMPCDAILSHLQDLGANVDAIILTHGHFDHIYYLDELKEKTGACVYIHKDDAEMLADGEKNAYSFFFGGEFQTKPADVLVSCGDEIKIGDQSLRVISVPGHSKGSICLLGEGFIITGDTLFSDGFGRYDLHGGDPKALSNSLSKLKSYDKSLMIYPGHGESTTLGCALENIYF